MKAIRLYLRFFVIQLKSMMQHKASFFFTVLGQFLVSEVLLCFSITLMA